MEADLRPYSNKTDAYLLTVKGLEKLDVNKELGEEPGEDGANGGASPGNKADKNDEDKAQDQQTPFGGPRSHRSNFGDANASRLVSCAC